MIKNVKNENLSPALLNTILLGTNTLTTDYRIELNTDYFFFMPSRHFNLNRIAFFRYLIVKFIARIVIH